MRSLTAHLRDDELHDRLPFHPSLSDLPPDPPDRRPRHRRAGVDAHPGAAGRGRAGRLDDRARHRRVRGRAGPAAGRSGADRARATRRTPPPAPTSIRAVRRRISQTPTRRCRRPRRRQTRATTTSRPSSSRRRPTLTIKSSTPATARTRRVPSRRPSTEGATPPPTRRRRRRLRLDRRRHAASAGHDAGQRSRADDNDRCSAGPEPRPSPAGEHRAVDRRRATRETNRRAQTRSTPPASVGSQAVPAARCRHGDVHAAPRRRRAAVAAATTPAGGRPARPGDRTHTVLAGESLWAIATDLLGRDATPAAVAREVHRLWQLNRDRIATGDPDLLMVGTRLVLR